MKADETGYIWPRCWACNKIYRGVTTTVVPISYAASGGLTSIIAQAKDEPERYWIRFGLASLLYTFLMRHLACLERFAGGKFACATVVPSHPNRRAGRDHLKELVATIPGEWPGVNWDLHLLTKVKESVADERRQHIDQQLFAVRPDVRFTRDRVLLIDDLYTSGSTTASAAHALVAAGAEPPIVVTIGRQLSAADEATLEFVENNGLVERGFEPDTCVLHGRSPSTFANIFADF